MTTRLVWLNAFDSATVAATSEASSSTVAANLQTPERLKVWRSSSAAIQQLTGSWTTTQQINCCIAHRHNLTSAGYWRLRLFSDAARTIVTKDSALILANPPKPLGELLWGYEPLGATIFYGWSYAYAQMWFDSVSAKGYELTFSDVTNPAGYLQASRIFMGPSLAFSKNPLIGMRLQYRENSQHQRSDAGSLRTDGAESWREMAFTMSRMPANERSAITDIGRRVGKRGDMFVSVFQGDGGTKERDHSMQCKFEDPPPEVASWTNRTTHDFKLIEA